MFKSIPEKRDKNVEITTIKANLDVEDIFVTDFLTSF
jgi:hypothetical protein